VAADCRWTEVDDTKAWCQKGIASKNPCISHTPLKPHKDRVNERVAATARRFYRVD
jgi:hypothetical protein